MTEALAGDVARPARVAARRSRWLRRTANICFAIAALVAVYAAVIVIWGDPVTALANYGALARDGISCASCHHMVLGKADTEKYHAQPQNQCVDEKQKTLNPGFTGFASTFTGAFLVGPPNADNRAAIEQFGDVPVAGEMPMFAPLNAEQLSAWSVRELDPDHRLIETLR